MPPRSCGCAYHLNYNSKIVGKYQNASERGSVPPAVHRERPVMPRQVAVIPGALAVPPQDRLEEIGRSATPEQLLDLAFWTGQVGLDRRGAEIA
eukprot:5491504-Pyramimonas_sp.AAC.1